MYINRFSMKNFRNYEEVNLEFNNGVNILYGDNAQGKTNLLEGIYVLGLTKSHRSFIDDHLIKKDMMGAFINGDLYRDSYKTRMEVNIGKTSKKLLINGNVVKSVSDYLSIMNIIIFYPDDLELIKGAPLIRRRYLNVQISQLKKGYFNLLNEYKGVLKIRNELLKKRYNHEYVDENYFDIITQYYLQKSIAIYDIRKKYVDDLNSKVGDIFFNLSGVEGFRIVYKSNMDSSIGEDMIDNLVLRLNKNRKIEEKLGNTLVGPHRDDIEIYLNECDIRGYGSQGQQRLAVLTLKLAEAIIFGDISGTEPILLLDDVFSELDDQKKNNLLNYIVGNMQTFITTTDYKSLDSKIIEKAKLFEIREGKIVKEG